MVRYEFVSVMHAAIETFPFHIYSKEPLKNLKREAQEIIFTRTAVVSEKKKNNPLFMTKNEHAEVSLQ